MKKAISYIAGALMAGVLSGCVSQATFMDEKFLNNKLKVTADFRAGFVPAAYQVEGLEEKLVPPHPNDSFLTASTPVQADNGWDVFSAYLGLGAGIGVDSFEFIGGLDVMFSSLQGKWKDDGDESRNLIKGSYGFYDFEKNPSDNRGTSSAFAYDKIETSSVYPQPFIGFRVIPNNEAIIQFELGLPIVEVINEWGHHRYSSEEKIGSTEEWIVGYRATLKYVDLKSNIGFFITYVNLDSEEFGLQSFMGGIAFGGNLEDFKKFSD